MNTITVKGVGAWTSKVGKGPPTLFYFMVKRPELRNGNFPVVDLVIEYLNIWMSGTAK